jgi:hypothetical protein
MDKSTTVLAFDLGASSGRAVKGTFSDGKLTCGEIHRFVNTPVEKGGSLCWDIGMLMEEIHKGIDKAGEFYSVSFDTWGVDFGLLDSSGRLIGLPVHYRDPRTRGMTELAARVMPPEELYARTGSQIMEHNTLFQLMAIRMRSPQTLAQAHTLLFMPDLLSYLLCGSICCERTIASTSQMLDPRTGKWRGDILKAFDLPDKLLPGCITPTGTVAGKYRGRIVTAGAGHDTQCAIAAMPEGEGCRVPFLRYMEPYRHSSSTRRCSRRKAAGWAFQTKQTRRETPITSKISSACGSFRKAAANGSAGAAITPSASSTSLRLPLSRFAASSTLTRRNSLRRAIYRGAYLNTAAGPANTCRRALAK